MIPISPLPPSRLPPRPAYAYRVGETARYRYEILAEPRPRVSALVTLAVRSVGRNGVASIEATVAVERDPAPVPTVERFAVDRWFTRVREGHGPEPKAGDVFDPLLRLEPPGLRPSASYALLPGDGGARSYEIVEEDAKLGTRWRKTIVLPSEGLPRFCETETRLATGAPLVHRLARLGP